MGDKELAGHKAKWNLKQTRCSFNEMRNSGFISFQGLSNREVKILQLQTEHRSSDHTSQLNVLDVAAKPFWDQLHHPM